MIVELTPAEAQLLKHLLTGYGKAAAASVSLHGLDEDSLKLLELAADILVKIRRALG